MINLSIWNKEKSIHSIEIDENDIKEFKIDIRRTYTIKNTFKKFVKIPSVNINGEWFNIIERDITVVKEAIKGRLKSNKFTEYEYKNGAERKATNWHYKKNTGG